MADTTRGLTLTTGLDGVPLHVYRPDDGILYCGRFDRLVTLSWLNETAICSDCRFYEGSAQGSGRECAWRPEDVGYDRAHVPPELESTP